MLKWFSNEFDRPIAVDNRHVTSVYDVSGDEGNLTIITTLNGSVRVKESSLDVVARLNERD